MRFVLLPLMLLASSAMAQTDSRFAVAEQRYVASLSANTISSLVSQAARAAALYEIEHEDHVALQKYWEAWCDKRPGCADAKQP
jgi:hypothetical protein